MCLVFSRTIPWPCTWWSSSPPRCSCSGCGPRESGTRITPEHWVCVCWACSKRRNHFGKGRFGIRSVLTKLWTSYSPLGFGNLIVVFFVFSSNSKTQRPLFALGASPGTLLTLWGEKCKRISFSSAILALFVQNGTTVFLQRSAHSVPRAGCTGGLTLDLDAGQEQLHRAGSVPLAQSCGVSLERAASTELLPAPSSLGCEICCLSVCSDNMLVEVCVIKMPAQTAACLVFRERVKIPAPDRCCYSVMLRQGLVPSPQRKKWVQQ